MKNLKLIQFLKELEELSKKHGIIIGGCGCCGSPFVIDKETGNILAEKIEWNNEKEVYTTNEMQI